MKLSLVTQIGSNSPMRNFPNSLTEEAALVWVGAYLKQHSRQMAPEVSVERLSDNSIRIQEVGQKHYYILEK